MMPCLFIGGPADCLVGILTFYYSSLEDCVVYDGPTPVGVELLDFSIFENSWVLGVFFEKADS